MKHLFLLLLYSFPFSDSFERCDQIAGDLYKKRDMGMFKCQLEPNRQNTQRIGLSVDGPRE